MKWCAGLLLLLISCNEPASAPPADKTATRNGGRDSLPAPRNPAVPQATVDLSPMDIAYFPVDYPVEKMRGTVKGPPVARVIYSRPRVQGRSIFGNLLKWGEPWRLGANEATEIEFFQGVTVMGTRIPPGRYTLYAVPQPDAWTLVFNSNLDTWGLQPDLSKDLHRFTIPVRKGDMAEYFTIRFEPSAGGADLFIQWADVSARLPVNI